MYDCTDTNCPAHFRNDSQKLTSNTLRMVRYLGEYAVTVDTASEFGEFLAMLGVQDICHSVNVYRVGHGSLTDVLDPETDDVLPGARVYSNTTTDAESAYDLAEDLTVMINAGTFNGDNL